MELFSENNDNDCCCPLFQVDLAHLLAAREQELRTLSAEVYMIKFCPLAFNFLNKQKENSIKAYNITLQIKRTSPTYTILCRIICMGYSIFPVFHAVIATSTYSLFVL